MSTKFNVYYATSANGPWTLANATPIDRDVTGQNQYTITGLDLNAPYYVTVVGGDLDANNNFRPLISQSVGPQSIGAVDVQVTPPNPVLTRTFSPQITTEDSLSHQFAVV